MEELSNVVIINIIIPQENKWRSSLMFYNKYYYSAENKWRICLMSNDKYHYYSAREQVEKLSSVS